VTRVGNRYYTLDDSHRLLTGLEPCKLSPVAGAPAATSLAALGRDTLVLAAAGAITAYATAADGALTPRWTLSGDCGAECYLAVAGTQVLVADTRRHRVLLCEGATPTQVPAITAQYGETDQAGNDLAHLNAPTLVSLAGARVVVYDAGNQRVVKLRVR
jgi:hypothetical protein